MVNFGAGSFELSTLQLGSCSFQSCSFALHLGNPAWRGSLQLTDSMQLAAWEASPPIAFKQLAAALGKKP